MAAGLRIVRGMCGLDAYEVHLDGVLLGEVRKKTTRYNLRRVITTIEWYGWLKVEGAQPKRVPDQGGYDTRRDAAAALVRAYEAAARRAAVEAEREERRGDFL